MTRGHTLPRGDIARINRTVTAFEAGEFLPRQTGTQIPRPGADMRAILLADLNATTVDGDTVPAAAVRLERAQDTWLLRLDSQENRPFVLGFQGRTTAELPIDISAEQLREQIATLTEATVAVVGRGMEFQAHAWSMPVWFVRTSEPLAASLTLNPGPEPGNWAQGAIRRTTDYPIDQVEDVYARYAGDARLAAGTIVTCRPTEIGYRIVGATLRPPPPCQAQNARIRVSLFGRPTGGVWSMWLSQNAVGESGELIPLSQHLTDLPWDITADDLQAIIDATPAFAGGVTVFGGPANVGEFELEFIEHLGHQAVPLPVLTWGTLSGVVVGAHAYYAVLGRNEPEEA